MNAFRPSRKSQKAWHRHLIPHKTGRQALQPLHIYLAASFLNRHQAALKAALERAGHQTIDARDDLDRLHWPRLDKNRQTWTTENAFSKTFQNPNVENALQDMKTRLNKADCAILVLPSGASSHIEATWLSARGLPVLIYAPAKETFRPELAWGLLLETGGTFVHSTKDALDCLDRLSTSNESKPSG